jgi:hypothetical protein
MHQQRRDPAISVAPILAGQGNDGLSQPIFIFTLCRPVALRASGLPQQKARMTLTYATLTGMADRTAPPLRA